MADGDSHYETLGVGPDASQAEVRRAWAAKARELHPDRLRSTGISRQALAAAEEKLKRVNNAYRILSDPAARARHDADLHRWSNPPRPVVSPTSVRFDYVPANEVQTASFVLSNEGGEWSVIGLDDPSEPWLKILGYSSLRQDDELPLRIDLAATGDDWDRLYSGAIVVRLDHTAATVQVRLRTKEAPASARSDDTPFTWPPLRRLLSWAAAVLIVGVGLPSIAALIFDDQSADSPANAVAAIRGATATPTLAGGATLASEPFSTPTRSPLPTPTPTPILFRTPIRFPTPTPMPSRLAATPTPTLLPLGLALRPGAWAAATPVIDGVRAPREWQDAALHTFEFRLPRTAGGDSVPAQLLVMNDDATFYLAIQMETSELEALDAPYDYYQLFLYISRFTEGDDNGVPRTLYVSVDLDHPSCRSTMPALLANLQCVHSGWTADSRVFIELARPLNGFFPEFNLEEGDLVVLGLWVSRCQDRECTSTDQRGLGPYTVVGDPRTDTVSSTSGGE